MSPYKNAFFSDVKNDQCLYTDFVFLDEVDKRSSLNLDRLSLAVIQRQDKVKEIALAKVARRLLLKVRSPHSETEHMHHPTIEPNIYLDDSIF